MAACNGKTLPLEMLHLVFYMLCDDDLKQNKTNKKGGIIASCSSAPSNKVLSCLQKWLNGHSLEPWSLYYSKLSGYSQRHTHRSGINKEIHKESFR